MSEFDDAFNTHDHDSCHELVNNVVAREWLSLKARTDLVTEAEDLLAKTTALNTTQKRKSEAGASDDMWFES